METIEWCDLMLAKDSAVVNGTAGQMLRGRPAQIFGVTIAGLEKVMPPRKLND